MRAKPLLCLILSFLNSCGSADQEDPQTCSNDITFVEMSLARSFETLHYSGKICLRGLHEIAGPGRAILSLEPMEGTGTINIKSQKINDETFEIGLPSDVKFFDYFLTRPADGRRIPGKLRISQSVRE